MKTLEGAYSLTVSTADSLLGIRDPHGLRPLALGKYQSGGWVIASESCAFDHVGAQFLREIEPGEAILIDRDGLKSFASPVPEAKKAHCVFEHIYFARPDSILDGVLTHSSRTRMGQELAREHPVDADLVIGVPDSANSAAVGYAQESGIPFSYGLIKNRYVGRTFIEPDQRFRELGVRNKFNPLPEVLSGKKIITLFSGKWNTSITTAKELLKKGLGSESKLTLAKFNLTQAETQLKEIIINFESKLINLESQLENVKSKIKNITIDINNTIISAPFDGIIQKSFIEEGQYIRQGDIIAKIVDLNPIKIQGYLSESDVNKVKVGTETNIKISNSLKKKGVISFISPVAETNTRTFEFIVEANNDDLLFKSGLTATILIEIESIKAHKISPSILSLDDNGNVGIKVLSEQNQVIFYQTKKIKDTIDGMWISGLPDKSNIIISGQEYVNVGEVIKIE